MPHVGEHREPFPATIPAPDTRTRTPPRHWRASRPTSTGSSRSTRPSSRRSSGRCGSTIRGEAPDLVEQVDFGNKLIAFGRSMQMRGLLFAIIAHQTWVNLQLADGADLPDPDGCHRGHRQADPAREDPLGRGRVVRPGRRRHPGPARRATRRPMTAGPVAAVSWGPGRIDRFWIGPAGDLLHAAFVDGAWLPTEIARRLARRLDRRRRVGRRPARGLRRLPRRRAVGSLLGRPELAPVGVARRRAGPGARSRRVLVVGGPGRRLGDGPRRPDLAPLVGRHAAGWNGSSSTDAGAPSRRALLEPVHGLAAPCSRRVSGRSGSATTVSGRGTTSTRSSAAATGRCSRAG